MKTPLQIFVVLVMTFVSPLVWAGAASSPFATFRNFKTLVTPGVESVVDVDADPIEATYVLRFGSDFTDARAEQLGIELESVPGYRTHKWLTERDVSVSFRSPVVRVGVMQWKEGRRAVVIGVMRNTGFLPRFFAGPSACKELFPADLPRAQPIFEGACDGKTPDLRDARDNGTNAAEEEVLEILRLQMRSGWHVDSDRLRTYVDRADHDPVIVFGLIQLAMVHMVELDHVKTLSVLSELQSFVDDQPSAINEAQAKIVRRMGEATFLRLIEVNLAAGGFAAISHWETHKTWASEDFDPELKVALAGLYRQALAPAKAAPLYLEIIALGPTNEVELLIELALTYLEADDNVRAATTVAYVRERYPNVYVPKRLRGVRDLPLVGKPEVAPRR